MTDARFTPEFVAGIWAALGTNAQAEFEAMLESWRECDACEPDVTEKFEALGLVKSVIATKADCEQPFAYEGGIVLGEPMWKLTQSGQAVADMLRDRRAALAKAASSQTDDTPQALASQDHPQEKNGK